MFCRSCLCIMQPSHIKPNWLFHFLKQLPPYSNLNHDRLRAKSSPHRAELYIVTHYFEIVCTCNQRTTHPIFAAENLLMRQWCSRTTWATAVTFWPCKNFPASIHCLALLTRPYMTGSANFWTSARLKQWLNFSWPAAKMTNMRRLQ